MSISEEILVAKLKGHTFNWSVYQYIEVYSHMDAEMLYIVNDAIEKFRIKIIGQNDYRVIDLCVAAVSAAVAVIAEREKFTDISKIKIQRATTTMSVAYMSFINQLNSMSEIVDTLLPYAINDILIQIRYSNA